MKDFERLLKNINKLDLNDIFYELWSKSDVKNLIVRLNTRGEPTSQLISGIDSEGKPITPAYKFNTIQIKIDKGQIVDWVTLYDTGEFYESFEVRPLKKGFRIEADPMKDGDSLFDKYGEEVVGLTDENTEVLLAYVKKDFEKELERRLFQ